MKTLLQVLFMSLTFFVTSKKATAVVLLPFSNAPQCQYQERNALGLSNSPITDIFISSKLNQITSYLEKQQDMIILNSESLCYGAFQEARGMNAYSGFIKGHHFIIFGRNLMTKIVNDKHFGPEFDYILAHEFAHFLQNKLGLLFQHPLPLYSTKLKELHADCMAGYMMYMTKMINLDNQSQLSELFQIIGDRHAIGDHGEKKVRENAFEFGINKALSYSLIQNYYHTSAQMAQSCLELIN